MPVLEKDIQKVIVQWLKLNKLEVSVTDASRTFSRDGGVRKSKVDPSHPDLTVVLPVLVEDSGRSPFQLGLAFYIEVKTPTGTIKDTQKEKLRALTGQGAIAIIARDLDVVELFVKAFKGKKMTAEKLSLAVDILELMLQDRRSPQIRKDLEARLNLLRKI